VTSVEEFFSDVYIPLDCEIIVAEVPTGPGESDRTVTLSEVYHVHPTSPLQKHRVGCWTPDGGLTYTSLPFYQRRNFHGITLKAAKLFGVR
jgi:hypothetical protein